MDRADATGFGVAALGHAALFAALSAGFAATRLPVPKSEPIEVELVGEVALESSAPNPAAEAPPPSGLEDEPPEPAVPPPAAQPVPQPRLAPPPPAPAQRAVPRPTPPKVSPAPPAPAPPMPARTKRGGAPLAIDLSNVSDRNPDSRAGGAPAAAAGPEVEASLVAEVRRQVKPHWQRAVPTGADAEALRTQLSLTLARDGRVTGIDVVGTTGVTASNRPQVALHQERARRAVTLASPFNLPAKYYDAWKQLNVTLDLRLSQ